MRVLLPLLLVGLAACYSPRSVTPNPHMGPYGEVYQEPLRASLWVDSYTSHASFELNRPAHVAIFAWRPGQQIHMIQPAVGHQMRQHYTAGSHSVWARTGHHFATRRASHARLAGSFPSSGPVYYMLIASAEPLHVAPFYGSARLSWAHQVTWSHNLYTATELLATQIVPDYENTEWTVAYHMAWHEDPMTMGVPPHLAYRWVHCPGGVVISVPIEVWAGGGVMCPELQPLPPPDTTAGPGTPADRDRRAGETPRRPFRPESMDAERPDEAEFRALLRQIRQARGKPADDVEAPPVPPWRRVEREALEGGAVVGFARPVIRPARAEYAAPHTGGTPASWRAEEGRGETSATRPGTRSTRAEPASRPTQRSTPAAERPSPRAERPAPTVQRPAPEARPSSPSPRPRPDPPPTREDPRGGG